MGRREDRDAIDYGRRERGRIYVPYDKLEEYAAGMWRKPRRSEVVPLMAEAVALLRDDLLFATALQRVLSEWPVSCVAEMTRPGNHLAWLGAAACCLVHGCPESLTRRAWWKLTECERSSANAVARDAELTWWQARQPSLFSLEWVR